MYYKVEKLVMVSLVSMFWQLKTVVSINSWIQSGKSKHNLLKILFYIIDFKRFA